MAMRRHIPVRIPICDHQFRIYVRLIPAALDTLARSQEFKRGVDNTVFHKGYPTNYRAQGGTPSIQISITPDGHRADIDVDYLRL